MIRGMGAALGSTAVALVIAMTGEAAAQERSPGDELTVGEVVVTAQRREERLQNVPISISALSGEELQRRRVDNVQDVLGSLPSVTFTTTGGNEARTDFSVRGVANQGGATSPFALYVDEVSYVFSGVGAQLGSVRGFDVNLLDIERLEVLRGPQGTYFGRNAIGGAINVITRKPSDRFEGYASVDSGFEGTSGLDGFVLLARAAVNVPLGDGLAVRLNGYSEEAEGYLKDLGPARNTNDREAWGARAALRWTPMDALTLDLTAAHSSRKRGVNSDIPTGLGLLGLSCRLVVTTGATACPLGALAVPGAPIDDGQGFWPHNKDRIATNTPSRGANRTTSVTARAVYELPGSDLTVVGGWVKNKAYDGGDLDYSVQDYIHSDRTNMANGENLSLEVRLSSDDAASDRLRWTAGVNGAREIGGRGLIAFWGAAAAVPPPFRTRLFAELDAQIETDSFAAFGEVAYALTEQLTATLGLRYSRDDVSTTSFSRTDTLGPALNVPAFSVSQVFEDVSPKFNVTYRWTPRVMTYATVSKGYKAGGFNPGLGATATNTPAYEPETLWNYEVGLKSELFARRLRVNLAAFQMDWKNIQVSTFDSQRISNVVSNAAAGRVRGFEAEVSARPWARASLDLAYGFNDGAYEDFPNCFTLLTTAAPISIDCSGRKFGSRHTFSAAAQQDFEVAGRRAYVRAEYAFRSRLWKIDDIPETQDPRSRPFTIGAYDTVNLRAGLEGDRWKLEVYGENIIGAVPAVGDRELFAFLSGEQATPLPRTVGLRAQYDF